MANVFLLLGSNLGNRRLFLQQAISGIEERIAPVIKKSSVYETQSWGNAYAPDYLNQVIVVETDLPAISILTIILQIEQWLGRERLEKWGARVIDLDILFYGDVVLDEPGLQVPHPRLHQRRFVLEPLAEIAPLLLHPVYKKTILELKSDLQDNLLVKKL